MKYVRMMAMAVAAMGVIHIVATFTPLVNSGLEVLSAGKQQAMTYMSLMCGMLLIVCGSLVAMLHDKVKEHPFLRRPYLLIYAAICVDGIAAVVFMPHNPFAWLVFILACCLAIANLYGYKGKDGQPMSDGSLVTHTSPRPRFTFNTVGLFTTDNAKTVAFYRDAFGFQTEWNGKEPNVEMHLDDSRIILFPRTDFEQMTSRKYTYPQGTNGTMELSFDVPTYADVDREYASAIEKGAEAVFPPTTEPWGQRTCYVADPEGNLIEISSFVESTES